jgi:Integrase core domain
MFLPSRITHLKIIDWGWFYLSTILDDYSRYIIAWKLCTTMKATDVTDTLNLALQASGCDNALVLHKPRLLSDNGSSYISADPERLGWELKALSAFGTLADLQFDLHFQCMSVRYNALCTYSADSHNCQLLEISTSAKC